MTSLMPRSRRWPPPLHRVRRRWRTFAEGSFRPRLLLPSIRHVHGPENVQYARDEVLLICLVRNGERHVGSFIEHHFGLGVRHIVFLDNLSTDSTVEIARQYPNVTILSSDRPFAPYELVMRRYLARRFSAGRWNLCVDIDERFDYPYSKTLDLRGLIAYLEQRSFTAVVAQMLDLFGPTGLASLPDTSDVMDSHRMYDTSDIRKSEYVWGTSSNPAVRAHRGGVRDRLFGTDNGLTKAALVFVDDRIELFADWHHVRNARVADITCVLLHYPFVDLRVKAEEIVRTRRYGVHTMQYARYLDGLERGAETQLLTASANVLETVDQLVGDGFLVVSDDYRAWVAGAAADSPNAATPEATP